VLVETNYDTESMKKGMYIINNFRSCYDMKGGGGSIFDFNTK